MLKNQHLEAFRGVQKAPGPSLANETLPVRSFKQYFVFSLKNTIFGRLKKNQDFGLTQNTCSKKKTTS